MSHPSSPAVNLAMGSVRAVLAGPCKSVTILSPPGSEMGLNMACSQSVDGESYIFVNGLAPGSPAAETNAITAGDRIVEINGLSVAAWRSD